MRTTVVPAQVTTVEDRIAGNLTFSQVLLLVFSLILSIVLYLGLAPRSHIGGLKMVLIGIQFSIFGGLSLRIGGKLLLEWLVVYVRYFMRPRIYVFTKNDAVSRKTYPLRTMSLETSAAQAQVRRRISPSLSISERLHIDTLMKDPSISIRFEPRKGGVDVSLVPLAE